MYQEEISGPFVALYGSAKKMCKYLWARLKLGPNAFTHVYFLCGKNSRRFSFWTLNLNLNLNFIYTRWICQRINCLLWTNRTPENPYRYSQILCKYKFDDFPLNHFISSLYFLLSLQVFCSFPSFLISKLYNWCFFFIEFSFFHSHALSSYLFTIHSQDIHTILYVLH